MREIIGTAALVIQAAGILIFAVTLYLWSCGKIGQRGRSVGHGVFLAALVVGLAGSFYRNGEVSRGLESGLLVVLLAISIVAALAFALVWRRRHPLEP